MFACACLLREIVSLELLGVYCNAMGTVIGMSESGGMMSCDTESHVAKLSFEHTRVSERNRLTLSRHHAAGCSKLSTKGLL